MSFTANPFDYTGTPPTDGVSGTAVSAFKGAAAMAFGTATDGTQYGAYDGSGADATTVDTSVAAVCPAFGMDWASLKTAAANRQQDERIP
jgi:hypothetical protein